MKVKIYIEDTSELIEANFEVLPQKGDFIDIKTYKQNFTGLMEYKSTRYIIKSTIIWEAILWDEERLNNNYYPQIHVYKA